MAHSSWRMLTEVAPGYSAPPESSVVGRTSCPSQPPPSSPAGTAGKRDRTHYLYIAVIVAVVAGIAVGFVAPELGKALKPLGHRRSST